MQCQFTKLSVFSYAGAEFLKKQKPTLSGELSALVEELVNLTKEDTDNATNTSDELDSLSDNRTTIDIFNGDHRWGSPSNPRHWFVLELWHMFTGGRSVNTDMNTIPFVPRTNNETNENPTDNNLHDDPTNNDMRDDPTDSDLRDDLTNNDMRDDPTDNGLRDESTNNEQQQEHCQLVPM